MKVLGTPPKHPSWAYQSCASEGAPCSFRAEGLSSLGFRVEIYG